MSMLSALARSPVGQSLLDFYDEVGLSSDWEDPSRCSVVAYITGRRLDNKNGEAPVINGTTNDELVVHLESPKGTCSINLATLLALGTAYIRQQFELARAATAEEAWNQQDELISKLRAKARFFKQSSGVTHIADLYDRAADRIEQLTKPNENT